MIHTNTSKYALNLNVSNVRRDLLYHLISLWKVKTFVVCTVIYNIKRVKNACSLIWLRKTYNGEHTKRKICSHKTSQSVRKVSANDTPTEENIGWSLLEYNAKFDRYPQRGTQC